MGQRRGRSYSKLLCKNMHDQFATKDFFLEISIRDLEKILKRNDPKTRPKPAMILIDGMIRCWLEWFGLVLKFRFSLILTGPPTY